MARRLFALLLTLTLWACDDGGTDTDPDTTGSDTTDVVACHVQPTITSLENDYFAVSCSFASCHGDLERGELNLTAGNAFADLVDIDVVNAGALGDKRVVAGDADASFIMRKVLGDLEADEGKLMPEGVVDPLGVNCQIEALRTWINNGAPAAGAE